MQPAYDFRDECKALAALVTPLTDAQFAMPTQFKGWTINMILRHLHVWNIAADLALNDTAGFDVFRAQMAVGIAGGRLPDFEEAYLNGLSGQKLCAAWVQQFEAMTPIFAAVEPKHRVQWVGPDMSVMSAITARLMETWAHGQAIYDALGVERIDDDRIGNIVRLGVNTYGWTWKNRRIEPPGPMPQLRLTAPSGALWEYGEASDSGMIEGLASEFCQVVTQCRNIADTDLVATGAVAMQWMAVAQCFAGPPQDPPAKGARYKMIVTLIPSL
jgi:uncharacterized protein (TIGR03084 family)